jgi:hypothetical protein
MVASDRVALGAGNRPWLFTLFFQIGLYLGSLMARTPPSPPSPVSIWPFLLRGKISFCVNNSHDILGTCWSYNELPGALQRMESGNNQDIGENWKLLSLFLIIKKKIGILRMDANKFFLLGTTLFCSLWLLEMSYNSDDFCLTKLDSLKILSSVHFCFYLK